VGILFGVPFLSHGPGPTGNRALFLWTPVIASLIFLCFPAATLAQAPAQGDFVINEVLADPAAGLDGDANGDGIRDAYDDEFVELVNVSAFDLDISGLTLHDSTEVRHAFPAGTLVPPGCAVVVFGGGSPSGIFGGALVQTATTGSLSLNNSGDSMSLMDGTTEIASFSYGMSGCEGDQNQSMNLNPDLAPQTCILHSLAFGSGGSLFSPGTLVDGTYFGDCGVLIFADDFESGNTSAWSSG